MINVVLQAATSAAVNVTSAYYDLQDLNRFSVVNVFSGGAGNLAGTMVLQASYDATTWFTVANSSTAVTSAANVMYDVNEAGYRYVRSNWTFSSGTGNLTVAIHIKENTVKMS